MAALDAKEANGGNVRKMIGRFLVVLAFAGLGNAAEAGLLYGIGGGVLVTIDPITGQQTTIGPLGIGTPDNPEGLSFAPDGSLFATIFAYASGASSDDLLSVDPLTGQATLIGSIGFREVQGIAASPNGKLYGAESFAYSGLIEIDRVTGQGTAVGKFFINDNNNREIVGLEFAADGRLFAVEGAGIPGSDSYLYDIDVSTGAASLIGGIGFANVQSIAFSADGRLYGTSVGQLLTIDPTTGQGTKVVEYAGQLPAIYGIDFQPSSVPIPATLPLFAIGLAGLGWSRRKKV